MSTDLSIFLTWLRAQWPIVSTLLILNLAMSVCAILALNKEADDYGIFNADYVRISDSSFENVGGALVNLYRVWVPMKVHSGRTLC